MGAPAGQDSRQTYAETLQFLELQISACMRWCGGAHPGCECRSGGRPEQGSCPIWHDHPWGGGGGGGEQRPILGGQTGWWHAMNRNCSGV